MPDAMEASREDVDEETADELAGVQCQGPVAGGAVLSIVLDAEGDGTAVEGGDPTRRDRDPMGVARQIGEDGLRPGERRLGVDDPALLADGGKMPDEGIGVGEMGQRAMESKLAARWRAAIPSRKRRRNKAPSTRTGRRKAGREAIQRDPSGESPPPGTIM